MQCKTTDGHGWTPIRRPRTTSLPPNLVHRAASQRGMIHTRSSSVSIRVYLWLPTFLNCMEDGQGGERTLATTAELSPILGFVMAVLAKIPLWWHFFVLGLTIVLSTIGSAQAILRKRDSRAAVLWVAFIWLVPLIGAVLYFVFGVNRI